MIDIILHVDQRSWQRLIYKFSSFSLEEACRRSKTQINHINQDPIIKGKRLKKFKIFKLT
jgi:hypothetical protein